MNRNVNENLVQNIQTKEFGIYIHIPFCIRKCNYCDFLSFPSKEQQRELYIKALTTEMDLFFQSEEYKEKGAPTTVFIGGGTPSVLEAEQICEILSHIPELDHVKEITMEANPGTLDRKKLEVYKQAGINRLSLGLQSVDNQELKLLGRIHTWEDFLENYSQARLVGFKNINIDLMSGLPGQTLQDWEMVLKRIAGLAPEHISAYSLIIEEGTPFFSSYGMHPEQLPSEEEIAAMYELTGKFLSDLGYQQYEISNYAYQGKECIHNLGYWYRKEYRGFGLGAASLLFNMSSSQKEMRQAVRFRNTNKMEKYLLLVEQGVDLQSIQREKEVLTKEEQMEETMFLGLRCRAGVSSSDFLAEFGIEMKEFYGDVIEKYCTLGFLEWNGNRLRLTEKALLVSNVVMQDFLCENKS